MNKKISDSEVDEIVKFFTVAMIVAVGNDNIDWNKYDEDEAAGKIKSSFSEYYIADPVKVFVDSVNTKYPDIEKTIGKNVMESIVRTVFKLEAESSDENFSTASQTTGIMVLANLFQDLA